MARNIDNQGNVTAIDPLDAELRRQMQAKVDPAAAPDASANPGEAKGPDYTPPPITTTTSPAGPMETQSVGNGMSLTTNPGYTINDLVNPKLTVTPPPTPNAPPPPPPPSTTTAPQLAPGGDNSLLALLQQGMDPQQAITLFNQVNKRGYGNEAVYYNDNRGITIGLPTGYYAKTPGGWTWTPRGPEGPATKSGGDLSGDTRNTDIGGFGANDQGTGVGGSLINSLVQQLLGSGGIFGQSSSGGSSSSYQNDPLRQQIMAALAKLISQGQEPVGDVSGDPSAVAYRLARTREAEKSRSADAERRASQGLLFSGPMESDIAGVNQGRAQDISTYEGQLATTILQDRQKKLEYALTTGAGYLQADQQLELQRQLNETNKALQSKQIQMQLINSLLTNQRFYDQLGFDIGQTELTGNQNAVNTVA